MQQNSNRPGKELQTGSESLATEIPENLQFNNGNNQWNEKKGANELSKKLKPGYIQVILNFSYYQQASCDDEDVESFFPRMVYLRLDESLIHA